MKRGMALWLAICLLAGLCLGGCGDDGSGRGFRFPLAAEPRQLDPQAATDAPSKALIAVLFEGLTRLDDKGQAVPALAEWTVSPDGLTYTFTLRESYWSTLSLRGEETPWDKPTPVTAADFVFGMQRAVDPATACDSASQLLGILRAADIQAGKAAPDTLGVQATDERHLVITLTDPDPAFPKKLATPSCMPCNREFFDYTAGRYGLEQKYLLCNGPFLLKSWNHDESLLLNKNEGYHAAEDISPAAVRYVIGAADLAAVQEGDIDAAPLTAAELDTARQTGVQTVKLEDRIRSVYFNAAAAPLSNVHLRQALRDSIEWQTVYDHLAAAGEPAATGYVAPAAVMADGSAYRRAENVRTFTTDITKAQTALGQALAALYPDKTSPSLPRLAVLAAEDTVSADLARYLIQSWQKHLKVYADLELVSEAALEQRIKNGRYQIAIGITAANGLTGAENLQAYVTNDRGNVTAFSDGAVDAAAAKVAGGSRAEVEALEALLADRCPTLPLSFPARYYGIAVGTKDVTVRPFEGGAYGAPFDFLHAKKWD